MCVHCGASAQSQQAAPNGAQQAGAQQAANFGAQQAATPTEWQPAPGAVNHVSLRLSVECDHCATAVALNGPAQVAHCDNCLKDSPLTRVPEELALAAEGYQQFGSSYSANLFSDPDPQCATCDASVPIAQYLAFAGASTTIPCPSCGTGCPTYPAPAWLKAKLPGALQIFGGDPQTAKEEGGLLVDMPEQSAQPIMMTCPSCTGALTITAANERTTACPYCQVSVFLPDELWKRMHPARTMQRWTLSYSGALKTAEDLESDREEAMEEAEERRSSQKRITISRRRAKKSKRKGWIITLTSIVGLMIAYLFGGPHAFLACGSTGDHAMEQLRECNLAVELLGNDVDVTYGISYGSMESSGNFEEASVTIPVKGSKSRGSYSYYAVRSGSNIQFEGTLEVDGRTIDIGTCAGNAGNTGSAGNAGNAGIAGIAGNAGNAGDPDDSLRSYNATNCSCIVEGEETDRKVTLKLSVDDDEATGPFQTYYRLGVGDQEFKLATSDVTAPKNLELTRAFEIAIHCGSDRVIISNQKQVTAWSLDDGHELWSTPLERKLNLLGDSPPKRDFSLTCREIKAKRGKLKIPTGKSKHITIDIASGDIKKKKSKRKSKRKTKKKSR